MNIKEVSKKSILRWVVEYMVNQGMIYMCDDNS
jgi:hypothetical protein